MGACDASTIIRAKTKSEFEKKFYDIVDDIKDDPDYEGYSGSVAEFDGLRYMSYPTQHPGINAQNEVHQWLIERAEKWGPGLVVELEPGIWIVSGVASE